MYRLIEAGIEAGLGLVRETRRFARDVTRGFTDGDIVNVQQILAGNIQNQDVLSYLQRRARLFSGFHEPPMRTIFSDRLSLVTPEDIHRMTAEINRIRNLTPEELHKELLQDAEARATRYGLITN